MSNVFKSCKTPDCQKIIFINYTSMTRPVVFNQLSIYWGYKVSDRMRTNMIGTNMMGTNIMKQNICHRTDGPAFKTMRINNSSGEKRADCFWYIEGLLDRTESID